MKQVDRAVVVRVGRYVRENRWLSLLNGYVRGKRWLSLLNGNRWLSLFSAVFLVTLGGCKAKTTPELDFVQSVAERGPLKLVVEVRPKQVWLGDPIQIVVSLHTPADYAAQLPAASDLGKLEIRSVDSPDPRPAAEGGLDWRRTFTVESYSSGTLEIPPLVAKYARMTSPTDTQPALDNELACDTLKIEVRSALTSQDSITQPRDITGTLIPRRTPWQRAQPWVLGGAIGVLALGGLALVWSAWRARRGIQPPILPEIWALQELALLEKTDWIATGQAREFYYRLSEIVRGYIEKKFSLAAPEMTTEEFLLTLTRFRSALPYDADRLRAFLEACDIVKYAAYSPRQEDAEQVLGTARTFVYETAAAAERAAQRERQQQGPAADAAGGHAA